MSRRLWMLTGLLAVLALAPGFARAAELKSHEVNDDEKTIHFTFKLSTEVQPTEEYFFDGNFYALHIPGLVLSRQQLKAGEVKAPKHLQDFYKSIRFVQGEGEAQLRIYLSKLCSPADPQLMGYDQGVIKVDLIKPLFKLEDGTKPSQAAAGGDHPNGSAQNGTSGKSSGADTGFIPDGQAAPAGPAPADTLPPTPASESGAPIEAPGGTLRTGNPTTPTEDDTETSAANPTAEPPSTAEPDAGPAEYAATPAVEILNSNTEAAPTKYSRVEHPAADPGTSGSAALPGGAAAGPGYKQFDLASVPASNVEIRAQPFRQAVMQLVADCGFNVVVDDAVDNTEVNLNFTQKELSLKSALDLLCIAYDLAYVVEDDAIVIKAK